MHRAAYRLLAQNPGYFAQCRNHPYLGRCLDIEKRRGTIKRAVRDGDTRKWWYIVAMDRSALYVFLAHAFEINLLQRVNESVVMTVLLRPVIRRADPRTGVVAKQIK